MVRRFYEELWNRWQLEAADELVSDELRFRGSLGALCEGRDVEPTGANVKYSGAAFFRLAGGTIEEAWVVGDTQELWRTRIVDEPGTSRTR